MNILNPSHAGIEWPEPPERFSLKPSPFATHLIVEAFLL
jgi:hypothetical protein